MATTQRWFYDEMKHAGVDYADPAQAQVYDERHEKFRDYRRTSEAILKRLGLGAEHTVIDIGAGTGAFTVLAAIHCKRVYAVGVSPAMLDCARIKAKQLGLTNILFCPGGFLTYVHAAEPADAIVSIAALHHLPDFWKQIGLKRAAGMIKPGGQLYLFDVVFPSDTDDYAACFDEWIGSMAQKVGREFAIEAETHIRDEFSTFDWIMQGLLERAGFRIDQAEYENGFGASFLCTRRGAP